MAENNSKTFIIGIIIFVVLVIGGFAFFAKKDVSVDQTAQDAAVATPAATDTMVPAEAPVTDATVNGTDNGAQLQPVPAPEATPAPGAEATPSPAAPEAAPVAAPATPAVESAPATPAEPTPTPTPADQTETKTQ